MKRNKKFYKEKELRRKVKRLDTLRWSRWHSEETITLEHPIHIGWIGQYHPIFKGLCTQEEKKILTVIVKLLNDRYLETNYTPAEKLVPEFEYNKIHRIIYELSINKAEFKSLKQEEQDLFIKRFYFDIWSLAPGLIRFATHIEYRITKIYRKEVPIIYQDEISEYDKINRYLWNGNWPRWYRLKGKHAKYEYDYNFDRKRKLEKEQIKCINREIAELHEPYPEIPEEIPFWILALEEYE